ncbi:MAG: hydrogenase maturation protease [Deltaproteobacteria bacterium]|nr:hydrogenase maturation protease [Deltaproteobacteria bacterium]MBW2530236.1 hydrogenase maturation protease [Deltaproteobacteria bacterium]
MRTLILGIGNPIMRDDGAGIAAADELARQVKADVVTGNASGLAVLDQLVGYDRAIIVDATCTGRDAPGTVRRWDVAAHDAPPAPGGAHETSLPALLAWGSRTWRGFPPQVVVYTIEAERAAQVGEGLCGAVQRGVEQVVAQVVDDHFSPDSAAGAHEVLP